MSFAEKLFLSDLHRILRPLPAFLRWKIYGLSLLMLIVAVLEVLSILSMTFTAMSVAAPQVLLDNPYMQAVLKALPAIATLCEDPRYFTLLASLGVVILTAVKNVLTAALFWRQAAIGEEISLYAGDEILGHYLERPYVWHISDDASQTMMALTARQSLAQLLVQILNVYTYAGTSVALVFILVSTTPWMILLILIVTGLLSWAVYQSMKKALDRFGKISVQAAMEENRVKYNAMRGIREILIYRQQPVFRQKFFDACVYGVKSRAFLSMAPPIPTWILEVYGFAAIPFTTWILIHFYNADMAMIAGVVTIVMLAAWRILPLLNRSLSSLVIARGCRPMAMLCLETLEAFKKLHSPPLAEPDPNFHFEKEITLEHVGFRYPAGDNAALAELNCALPKGGQIGLVGLSGSGKSTLASLLSGLFSPCSGRFLLDGIEPDAGQLSAYRLKVGYVPQTPYIMAGSIAENVAFSQWGKQYDAERVRRACKMAALDIVETDPRGIDYPLGENGSGLSGGQAQRVAIARALYADPEILILDESTSALDQHTENEIMRTINKLKNKLTIIIIAHRLTTVEQCDHIVWLENGRIRKQGPTYEILEEYKNYLKTS